MAFQHTVIRPNIQ